MRQRSSKPRCSAPFDEHVGIRAHTQWGERGLISSALIHMCVRKGRVGQSQAARSVAGHEAVTKSLRAMRVARALRWSDFFYLRTVRHLGNRGNERDPLLLVLLKRLKHPAVYGVATHGDSVDASAARTSPLWLPLLRPAARRGMEGARAAPTGITQAGRRRP